VPEKRSVVQAFHEVRNLGRLETPHAWALENAMVLSQIYPDILKSLEFLSRFVRASENAPEEDHYRPYISKVTVSEAREVLRRFQHLQVK
jgi:hypothetical protein